MLNRALNVVMAAGGLMVTLPLMALISVAIKLTSHGPIFYRGTRAGLNGKPFKILKFRTMVPNAESLGGSVTSANDSRITPFGVLLRRYKLDELPQLINVIKGEMSIVGPRPEVFRYVRKYDERNRRILGILPGLTDWASLWDIDEGHTLEGCADAEDAYARRILPMKLALQNYYLDHHSVAEDLRIMLYTVIRIFCHSWIPGRMREVVNTALQTLATDCEVQER
jgi:lipopolysaccharide/colanic/teichoic acid biosynthesis glycosyltransferase